MGAFHCYPNSCEDRAFFPPFSYLILWCCTSPSVHHTLLDLRMAVNLSQKKLFIKMLNEVLQNQGYQLIPPQLSFLKYVFSGQRKVVVCQKKECQKESSLFVVADCCVELKPTMTSPGQFFFFNSCHFLSKQTQTCSYRMNKNEPGNNRLYCALT